MKKIFFLIFASLINSTLQAQVPTNDCVVYKQNFTVTRTGAGVLTKIKVTGWLFINPGTDEQVAVYVDAAQKRFGIETVQRSRAGFTGPMGKTYSLIQITNGTLSGLRIQGLETRVVLFDNEAWQLPARGSISGNYLRNFGYPPYYDEYKGTFVLDKLKTQNPPVHESLMDRTVQIQNELIAKGYTKQVPLVSAPSQNPPLPPLP